MSDGLIHDETGAQLPVGYILDVRQIDRRARCMLMVADRHLNQGVLHGGITATLLDNACGATASLKADDIDREPFTTLSLTVDYIEPGRVVTA